MEGGTGRKLLYDIHLKAFERAKESWQLDGEQKVEQAKILKEKGTIFFKVCLKWGEGDGGTYGRNTEGCISNAVPWL